jgi:hypothetical protein
VLSQILRFDFNLFVELASPHASSLLDDQDPGTMKSGRVFPEIEGALLEVAPEMS